MENTNPIDPGSREPQGFTDAEGFYLREIAGVELPDREAEMATARECAAARDRFARLVGELPDECRDAALEGEEPVEGRWPFDRIERCWDRLLERARRGDPALAPSMTALRAVKRAVDRSREALIVGNLRLVPFLVRRLGLRHRVAFLDLVQEGNVGLMRAVDRFDPERGHRFSTYAAWWIRQALHQAMDEQAALIRLPAHVRDGRRAVLRETRALRTELGRLPSDAEVGQRLGLAPEKVGEWRAVVTDAQSLDQGRDEGDLSMTERIPADSGPTPLERVLGTELEERIAIAIDRLNDRERGIVRLRFGFEGPRPLTLREVAELFGLSRERVRQIERDALAKMLESDRDALTGASHHAA